MKTMTLQILLEYLQQLIEENPERNNNHVICKYTGEISELKFRNPTLDEIDNFDLNYQNEYLLMS